MFSISSPRLYSIFNIIHVSRKESKRLAGCVIKRMRSIFNHKTLIYSLNNNVDEKILFDEITHHLNTEIRKMLVNGKFGNRDSTFHSGP